MYLMQQIERLSYGQPQAISTTREDILSLLQVNEQKSKFGRSRSQNLLPW